MPSVFLSYSQDDLSLVEQLEAQLKAHPDISIWRDQEKIYGGQKWPKVLGEAIAEQDVFLLVWSKHSSASHFVEFEWCTAIALKKTIIPCLLDETPLAESLRAYHAHPMSDSAGILRTLSSAKLADAARHGPVIRTLNDITAIEQKTVLEQVKTIFAQQQWTVQGSVYQAGGDIHFHNTVPLPQNGQEKNKPLIEKSKAWAGLAATILTIVTSLFVIHEKFQDLPTSPTILAPVPDGKPEVAAGQPLSGTIFDEQNTRLLGVQLGPLRQALVERIENGQRVTVLLVATSGGPYVESTESRIRDRYAIGTALGVACYVPENEGRLSFIEWEPQGAIHALPYEWYRLRETQGCGKDGSLASSVLVVWLPDEALSRRLLTTLASLSRSLVCQELRQKHDCLLTDDTRKLARLNPAVAQAVTFKIVGPRSSSAFRALLQEAEDVPADSYEGIGLWPNLSGAIELYSPWASSVKGLLAYGLKTEGGKGEACTTYEACEQEFYRRLANAHIQLVYDVVSDDQLFGVLLEELERRQVHLGWDAIILIGKRDSSYGSVLSVEFRAAACAKVATFSEADLRQILVPTTIKSWCPTVARAIDLQIQRPADYESLTLNVFHYSHERQEGTGQLDYVRALVARIHEDGEGARAIGILGTDPYDSLLTIKALRPSFPHTIFFTVDLDARYLDQSEYKSTRNMVTTSPFGLQLDGGFQREVLPFRSSYQTAMFFAVLRAVNHVTCRVAGDQQNPAALCPGGYHVAMTPEDRIYDAAEHPRIFEVGREGAVDLSVVDVEGVRTIHPLRADLEHTDNLGPLRQGVEINNMAVAATLVVALLIAGVVAWTTQQLWLAVMALIGLASFVTFVYFDGAAGLLANHDAGEPFSWTAGVSVWPSELLRLFVVILSLAVVGKVLRDLGKNSDTISKVFLFEDDSDRRRFSRKTFWTNLQRVYRLTTTKTAMTVDQAWSWYREADKPSQRIARTILLFYLYLFIMFSLDHWVLGEEMIHPCRGQLSCAVDSLMTLSNMSLVVFLNLAILDAVMLCRRWIGWVTDSTGGWSEQVQEVYLREHGLSQGHKAEFDKLKYLAVIDLIAQRTVVVNRLIRYPFIALLIMVVAQNNYFDRWNYPVILIVGLSSNVALALMGAFLLYQSASKAKAAMLARLSREMVQALGVGKDHDVPVKQIQQVIEKVEANEQGAFVPFYQQPVIESSLYGIVALLQYWYMK